MRVVVPIVSSADTMSGVTRHAINMVQSLLLTESVKQVHVVAGQWQQYVPALMSSHPKLSLEMVKVRSDIVSRNLWYAMELPFIVRRQRADIVHYSFPAPLWPTAMNVPAVVTLHDLYPHDLPENFGLIKAPFNRMILRQCLRAADAIACVSHSTLDRLERIDPILALRSAHVIPNCVHAMDEEAKPLEDLNDPFVLCVAQHRRNKNLLLLLRSFWHLREMSEREPNLRLLIVGMNGPETSEIKSFIDQYRLQKHVLLKCGLSEGELRWCYRECLVLVAPSVVEGFGLPVAEALLEGCRVVCSDIPPFREVGKHHCRYVSLESDAAVHFARAIAEECERPKPMAVELPQYGLEAIALRYEELYCSVAVRKRGAVSQKCEASERMKGHVEV